MSSHDSEGVIILVKQSLVKQSLEELECLARINNQILEILINDITVQSNRDVGRCNW